MKGSTTIGARSSFRRFQMNDTMPRPERARSLAFGGLDANMILAAHAPADLAGEGRIRFRGTPASSRTTRRQLPAVALISASRAVQSRAFTLSFSKVIAGFRETFHRSPPVGQHTPRPLTARSPTPRLARCGQALRYARRGSFERLGVSFIWPPSTVDISSSSSRLPSSCQLCRGRRRRGGRAPRPATGAARLAIFAASDVAPAPCLR